jgi:hypothetical protein
MMDHGSDDWHERRSRVWSLHSIVVWVFAALKARVHVSCKNVGNERRGTSIVARQG